jgi:pimeloyl-ACP methyl ester carboxylesterase
MNDGRHSVGHTEWWDPLWELESPTSAAFQAAVRAEDKRWSKQVRSLAPSVRRWRKRMEALQSTAYPEKRELSPIEFDWSGRRVYLQPGSAGYTQNVWIAGWSAMALSAIGFGSGPWFYTLEDVGKGAEDLCLTVWKWPADNKTPTIVWKRQHVGPSIAMRADRIYYSTVENLLRYPDVWSADLTTGKGARRLFHEPDKRVQVTLMERDDHLFIHTANALFQRLGVLEENEKVRWITEGVESSTLVPILPTMYARNDHIVDLKHFKEVPYPAGHFLEDVRQGPGASLFVVTVSDGSDHLWLLNDKWNLLLGDKKELSHIEIVHEPTELPTFLVHRPSSAMTVWEFTKEGRMVQRMKYPEPVALRVIAHRSTGVPYTVVASAAAGAANPKKLLVEAYGAYGISARRSYPLRWLAWIRAGYAVAYVCPRGGREKGDEWYNGARTALRKAATFEDTASAIADIQRRLSIAPAATVFFGRSAGGWLAAAIAQKYGDLVAAVYAEVPYVDVLNTTSNPTLPLTQLEYDEFGDPRRPEEYEALRLISPVDTVPRCDSSSPCPLLVVRTALNDKQVLPYESLKWAAHLRMAGWPAVYVGIDHDGGHFAAAKTMVQQRAEDAAILDTAIAIATAQGRRANRTRRKRSTNRSPHRSSTTRRTKRRR